MRKKRLYRRERSSAVGRVVGNARIVGSTAITTCKPPATPALSQIGSKPTGLIDSDSKSSLDSTGVGSPRFVPLSHLKHQHSKPGLVSPFALPPPLVPTRPIIVIRDSKRQGPTARDTCGSPLASPRQPRWIIDSPFPHFFSRKHRDLPLHTRMLSCIDSVDPADVSVGDYCVCIHEAIDVSAAQFLCFVNNCRSLDPAIIECRLPGLSSL